MMTGKAIMPSLPKRNMKRGIHWNWSFGLVLAVLLLAVASAQESFNQATNPAPALGTAAAPEDAPAPAANQAPPASAESSPDGDVVDAPAQPISTEKPLPPAVKPTAPVAEVLRLADSGVEESVLLAFVTNSASTFNLGAEEIIYLNDLGIPSAVVAAMIQRDQALKASYANAAPGPATAPPVPAEPAPAAPEVPSPPAPADMAPQPDSAAGSYPAADDATYAPFYDPLAPYGTWVDVAGYGACWQPSVVIVNPGWQPYCNGGRWVYTDCGWYWLSGYSWGWAPFHYGRWFRHNHYGWCWRPGNTWGPSWVCWRYSGNYCGWAPLPPAAVYQPAVGFTYHGQHVSGSFAFGLGVNSYTFVPVSQFPDSHLQRYALPHQQASQIYRQTVPSTTIVGNGTRIVNQGIPVSHVAAASRTQIHTVGIREMNTPGARGVRGEQLEANSRTLSVFRPQFTQSSAAPPAFGGRPRSDSRPTGGKPVATPTPMAPRAAPLKSPRAVGGSPAAQPGSGGGSGRKSDRSANPASVAPVASIGSAPTIAPWRIDPAPRLAQPLILHGSDRSREAADGTGPPLPSQATPPNSLIVRGNGHGSPWQALSQSPAATAEGLQSRPTAPSKDGFSRPTGMQPRHPVTVAEAAGGATAQPQRSISRAVEPPVRNERPWQPAAPIHKAPTDTAGARSYSPPAPYPARRAEPMALPAAHSTSYAPPASAPAAHSGSSSDKGHR
jgi:hypothetical protein